MGACQPSFQIEASRSLHGPALQLFFPIMVIDRRTEPHVKNVAIFPPQKSLSMHCGLKLLNFRRIRVCLNSLFITNLGKVRGSNKNPPWSFLIQ